MSRRDRIVWCDSWRLPHKYGFCPSEKAWRTYMRASKMQEDDYPTHRGCTSLFQQKVTKCRVALVTINTSVTEPRAIMSLLVHEGAHVWQDLREALGEKEPSSEFEAYAMQIIASELIAAYETTRGGLLYKRVTRPLP